MQDNPFWRFSCEVYARPGVQQLLLALQDSRGQDVNLILFGLWLGVAEGRLLPDAPLPGAAWHQDVIVPLRAARRAAKGSPSCPEGFREALLRLELEAENARQAELFAWSRETASPAAADAGLRNLHALGLEEAQALTLMRAAAG